jgi:hypothetical protein
MLGAPSRPSVRRSSALGLWPDACCFVAAKRENRCGRWLLKPCPIPQSAVDSAISIAFRLTVGLTETPLMVLSSVSLLLHFARAPDVHPNTCTVVAWPKCVLAIALTQRHDASPTAVPHATMAGCRSDLLIANPQIDRESQNRSFPRPPVSEARRGRLDLPVTLRLRRPRRY